MALDPLTAILDLANGVGSKLINKIFPDKIAQENERAKATLELLSLQNDFEIKQQTTQLSAIIAEAQSVDPWTSRARPSFLYVIYIMLLLGVPMGVLSAFKPELATLIASGLQQWLAGIPDSPRGLFGGGWFGLR